MTVSSRPRESKWVDARCTHKWVQIGDDVRWLRDGSLSLKKYWRRYGGRWTRLKTLIRNHRGDHCEKCGAEGVTLEAHEVWEYIGAASAGSDPKEIRKCLKAHREQSRGNDAGKRARALVRVLVDIKLLCQKCHGDAHYSLMGDYQRDFIMETRYSGLCELPDFRSYAEWESAMKDEADLRNEDERFYLRLYPEE